jgi:hypothetical protein
MGMKKRPKRDDPVSKLIGRLPETVVRLHRRIRSLERKAARDETTNARARALRGKAQELRMALRADCPHLFLFGYSGYEGSYSYDYDDAYCGQRSCAVCNIDAYAESSSIEEYPELPLSEDGLMLDISGGDHLKEYRALTASFRTAALREVLRRFASDLRSGVRGVRRVEGENNLLVRTPEFYRIHERLRRNIGC